jgi:NAD(P)-dependent dehydrogenase (short-subunit alcohol dehydrogenase family)
MAARLPGGRIGRAENIANAIGFLIGDGFVTGTVLHAEGGQVLV